MFERYTEKARRVIFFGRYEASQLGSPYIQPEHLLLGILREDKGLANRFFGSHAAIESIREQIEAHATDRQKIATSVDLPLNHESKRILAYAAEEADHLSQKHISSEHLLLGLLREEKTFAAQILSDRGLRLSTVREKLTESSTTEALKQKASDPAPVSRFGKDLTKAAADGQLNPAVPREREVNLVLETLCRKTRNSPVLIGEPALAQCVVETVALRIVEGAVPAILYDKKILACDISRLVAEGGGDRARYTGVIRSLSEAGNVIAFIEGIDGSLGSALSYGSLGGPSPLASLVSATGLNCIIATASHRGLIEKDKTLAAHVQEIRLVPLTEMECRTMLTAMIGELETFHGMSFEEDAITAAIIHGKEIQAAESVVVWVADLLDRTAAHVRIQREKVPPNLRDVQRRIRIAAQRMEDALANHDLAKARLCSDEERELRGTLRQLLGKYQFDEKVIVTERDIAAVVDLWGGASLE